MSTHDNSPAMQKARQATWDYEADAASGILHEGTPESTARLVVHAVRLSNALAQLIIYVDDVQRSWSRPGTVATVEPASVEPAGQPIITNLPGGLTPNAGALAAVIVGPPHGQHARPASRLETADPPAGHYQPRHAGPARTLEANLETARSHWAGMDT